MQRCLYPFAYVYHNAMIAGTSSASLRHLRLIPLDNDTSVKRSVKMSVKIFPFIKAELLLILFVAQHKNPAARTVLRLKKYWKTEK